MLPTLLMLILKLFFITTKTETNPRTWHGQDIPIGGQVFVTYAFNTDPSKGSYVHGATPDGFVPLDQSFRDMVREVLTTTSEIAGITFIEVDPETSPHTPMLMFHGSSDTTFGGFANIPNLGNHSHNVTLKITPDTEPNDLVSTTFHELGHAMGLRHPFDDFGIYPSIAGTLYDHQFFHGDVLHRISSAGVSRT